MNKIQISNVAIRQISDTLYNLTDLHKAAGGNDNHKPAFWLRNQQTQDLIAEIEAEGGRAAEVVHGGKNRGTYVCKELVIAYGMWISPAFALKVIRCFLEAQGQVSDGLPAKTTADDRTPLRQAVAALVGRKGIDYSTAYGMVHQRFNVGAIEDIPAGKLPEAVAYVHALRTGQPVCGLSSRCIKFSGSQRHCLDATVKTLDRSTHSRRSVDVLTSFLRSSAQS